MSIQNVRSLLPRAVWCVILSYVAVWSFIAPTPVQAWGNTGHEAVAWVAWQQLKPQVKTRVLALLKLVPAVKSPTGTTVPGYQQWVADLPSGLSQDQQNLYLFMRAATWADSIKHVGFQDLAGTPGRGRPSAASRGRPLFRR
jgi:hypothetical protein